VGVRVQVQAEALVKTKPTLANQITSFDELLASCPDRQQPRSRFRRRI
jgi:hypothetical protein